MSYSAESLFFGFFRSGEITVPRHGVYDPAVHMNLADVSINSLSNPSIVKLRLKASKTDNCVGPSAEGPLCPIISGTLVIPSYSGTRPGFLFRFADGRLLSKTRFVATVREAMTKAGLQAKDYAGLSFRIGAATTAGHAGSPIRP